MAGKFVIKNDKSGQFRFTLKAGNGEPILASEAYTTKAACSNGIDSVRTNSQVDERYQRKQTSNGQHYFNLIAANYQVIGTSEHYASKGGMENGIQSVKENAPTAIVDDQSEK